MTDLPDSLMDATTPAMLAPAAPRKCRRHEWVSIMRPVNSSTEMRHTGSLMDPVRSLTITAPSECSRCGAIRNEAAARRGRQSRNYGNRAELTVARTYGGVKVGHAGGPVDVRGAEFATQVKTHRRLPPAEWRKAFAAMDASSGIPRLLLRFVVGNGQPPVDYFVLPAKDWLDWFGRDEEGTDGHR